MAVFCELMGKGVLRTSVPDRLRVLTSVTGDTMPECKICKQATEQNATRKKFGGRVIRLNEWGRCKQCQEFWDRSQKVVCPDCGKTHRAVRTNPPPRCEKCAYAARLARKRAAPPSETICQHCGESFTPKRSDAVYCSAKCRVYAHRKKEAK